MRKWVYSIFAILILIILILPLIHGVVFKQRLLQLIDTINTDNRAKVEIVKYNLGWFHSQTTLRVTLNKGLSNFYQVSPTTAPTQPFTFTIDENISHGPIMYDHLQGGFEFGYAKIYNNIHISNQLETLLLGPLKNEGIIQIEMISEFNGNWSGHFHVPALSLSLHEMGSLTWAGLTGDFNFVITDKKISHVIFTGLIESILMQTTMKNGYFSKMMTQPIKYTYDVMHQSGGLISGNTKLYTRGVTINKQDGINYNIEKFSTRTAFSMDNTTVYNTNASLFIKNLDIPDAAFPSLSQIHLSVFGNNLNVKGLTGYLDYFNANTQETAKPVDVKIIDSLLAGMIMPTSVFRANVSLNTPLGSFNCHLKSIWHSEIPVHNSIADVISSAYTKINFIISPGVANKISELYNDDFIVQSTNGQNSLTKKSSTTTVVQPANLTPTPAQSVNTEAAKQFLNDLVIGGFFDKDQYNNYTTKLTIESGVWKLNGRAVN